MKNVSKASNDALLFPSAPEVLAPRQVPPILDAPGALEDLSELDGDLDFDEAMACEFTPEPSASVERPIEAVPTEAEPIQEEPSEEAPVAPSARVEEPSEPTPAPVDEPEDRFPGVPAPLRVALEGRGFEELTPVQTAVLAADIEGRDLQISSQTGSGKTVALGLVLAPALASERVATGPEALIIVPTRELANQVSEELSWLFAGLQDGRVASVTGGTPMYRDAQLLARRPRVLVGTPGRLLDHVSSGKLDLSGVRELVLDEADQMLDMGFREELEGILDTTPESRRTHLVSATFPAGIQQLAERYQRETVSIEGTRLGHANQDIEHEGYLIQQRDRYDALVNLLLMADGERTLVFVERRADALEVAERLEADGFAALPLSGELAQSQRERTLAAFRAGRATVLVATDVAARGLDVPDVGTVIHTAPPIDSQVYTHRSGRTGRAGKRGRSVLLSPPSRQRRVARLLQEARVELRWKPLPTAAEVHRVLAERDRRALEAELATVLAEGPSEARLAQAEALLAREDAAPLVAALLGRLEPVRQTQPRDVESLRPKERPRHEGSGAPGQRPQGNRPDYANRPPRGGDFAPRREGFQRDARDDRRPAPTRAKRQPAGAGSPFGSASAVRFFINWGFNQGANPSRLLASICRRGEVTGADVGSIAIHPNASTFDVDASVAERFEHLAGRRDPRDPHTRIRRDRGPARSKPQGSHATSVK